MARGRFVAAAQGGHDRREVVMMAPRLLPRLLNACHGADPMTRHGVRLLCAALALLPFVSTARAQEHNSLAVGVSVTHRFATDARADPDDSVGLTFRWGHTDTGWGWQFGLNWFATNLERQIGNRVVQFGELKVRPVLVGYGYTKAFSERVSVTAELVGGLAVTTFELAPEADDALHALAAQSVRVSTGLLTPVLRPQVDMWYDLNRKFGLRFGGGYVMARPKVTLSTSISHESERVKTDAFAIGAGVVYRLF